MSDSINNNNISTNHNDPWLPLSRIDSVNTLNSNYICLGGGRYKKSDMDWVSCDDNMCMSSANGYGAYLTYKNRQPNTFTVLKAMQQSTGVALSTGVMLSRLHENMLPVESGMYPIEIICSRGDYKGNVGLCEITYRNDSNLVKHIVAKSEFTRD